MTGGYLQKNQAKVGAAGEVFFLRYVNNVGYEIDESNLICAPRCYVHQICSQGIKCSPSPSIFCFMSAPYMKRDIFVNLILEGPMNKRPNLRRSPEK
jgi:hypothetical protein